MGKVQEIKQLTGVVNHTLCTCSSLVNLRWQIELGTLSGASIELRVRGIGVKMSKNDGDHDNLFRE